MRTIRAHAEAWLMVQAMNILTRLMYRHVQWIENADGRPSVLILATSKDALESLVTIHKPPPTERVQ
jgi:hypothetical protein